MKIVMVRHVETFGNVEHRLNGHTESDYTQKGERMKEQLVKELTSLHKKIKFDEIYASPTHRALQIAEDVGMAIDKKVKPDSRLKEFNFGIFEGKTWNESIEIAPKEWEMWMDDYLNYTVPGGQSQQEYHRQCHEFIKDLNPDKTLLIIAHGGTIHGILTNLLDLPINSKWHFDIKLGSITTVTYQDNFGMLSEMITPKYDVFDMKGRE
jgi:alpha-ribazole phosphatase/probable phosphoglycerate mutase